jgi:hypothetical protein
VAGGLIPRDRQAQASGMLGFLFVLFLKKAKAEKSVYSYDDVYCSVHCRSLYKYISYCGLLILVVQPASSQLMNNLLR